MSPSKKLLTLALLGGGVGIGSSAQALPILSENAAQNVSSALTLYRDDNNPNLFYFMPNSSTFAREQTTGLPAFGFVYWGLNGGPITDAGAYMTFTLRLTSDPEQKAALDSFLKENPAAGIAVVPVMESTVGLTSTTPGQAPLGLLFNEFDFSHKAGRAEDEVGVNAVMTGIGARAIKAGIDNPQVLKIDYCYKVQGLGPAFQGIVDVDWSRVYTEFEAHASGGGWFSSWSVNTTIERLREEGAIKLDIRGGTAKDEEYIKSIAEKAVERMFKPDLSATPGSTQAGGGGWSFTKLTFNYTDRREFKQEHYEMIRRDLVEREFCTPMRISDIAADKDKVVRKAD